MVRLSLTNKPLVLQIAADPSSSSSPSDSSSSSDSSSEDSSDGSQSPALLQLGVWLDEELNCPYHRECCDEKGTELEDAEQKGEHEGEGIIAPYRDLVDSLYHSVRPVIYHRARRSCFRKMMLGEAMCKPLTENFDTILANLGRGLNFHDVCVNIDFCEASPKEVAAVAAVALAQQGGPPMVDGLPSVIVPADHNTIFFPHFN